ncbi:MAG: hypothetical protein Q8M06_10730 [Methanobacteriaceae archaeon]|nr:hypothetical protein [Methanobacteriaceae archaeon]
MPHQALVSAVGANHVGITSILLSAQPGRKNQKFWGNPDFFVFSKALIIGDQT